MKRLALLVLLLGGCDGWGAHRCKAIPDLHTLERQVIGHAMDRLFSRQSIPNEIADYIRRNPDCCSLWKTPDSDTLFSRLNNIGLDTYAYSIEFAYVRDGEVLIAEEIGVVNACGGQVERLNSTSLAWSPRNTQVPPTSSQAGGIPQVTIVGKPIIIPQKPAAKLIPLSVAKDLRR